MELPRCTMKSDDLEISRYKEPEPTGLITTLYNRFSPDCPMDTNCKTNTSYKHNPYVLLTWLQRRHQNSEERSGVTIASLAVNRSWWSYRNNLSKKSTACRQWNRQSKMSEEGQICCCLNNVREALLNISVSLQRDLHKDTFECKPFCQFQQKKNKHNESEWS
jgi:hypothetical protein